jgi:hypothetical protein
MVFQTAVVTTTKLGASQFVLLIAYYYSGQIEEDEIGGTCSIHGKDEKCIKHFG